MTPPTTPSRRSGSMTVTAEGSTSVSATRMPVFDASLSNPQPAIVFDLRMPLPFTHSHLLPGTSQRAIGLLKSAATFPPTSYVEIKCFGGHCVIRIGSVTGPVLTIEDVIVAIIGFFHKPMSHQEFYHLSMSMQRQCTSTSMQRQGPTPHRWQLLGLQTVFAGILSHNFVHELQITTLEQQYVFKVFCLTFILTGTFASIAKRNEYS